MVQTFKQHQRPRVAFNKLQKRLRRQVGKAIEDYHMIEDGDRVMVCLSGGKDSYTMLDILLGLQKSAPIRFDIVAVNMDQKQPGFPEEVLPSYLDSLNIEYYIVEKDTYSIVKSVVPEGKTTCALCSRLRRGTLYGFAEKINATKLALGHHRDDIVETLFLNMFHGGRLKAMPPKLLADDRRNVLIRPLAYCSEEDIAAFAAQKGFPIIPCNLCGSQENLQRKKIKAMLKQWELDSPGRVNTIFSSLQRVSLSQLADQGVFDFKGLRLDRNTTEGNGSDGDDSKGNDSKGNDSKGNDSKGNDSKGNDSKGNSSEGNSSSGLVDQRDSVEACLSGMNAIPVVNLG